MPMKGTTPLEMAVQYAEVGDGIIQVSPKLGMEQREAEYRQLLTKIPSSERLVELQIRLENDLPYFLLCDDAAIEAYFSRWHVPIQSRADLDLFAQTLSAEVMRQADGSAETRNYVAQRDYQRELRGLPTVLNQLEQVANQFRSFEKPMAAVLRYVWEAVKFQGFQMKYGNSKDAEASWITICPLGAEAVSLYVTDRSGAEFRFHLEPAYTKVERVVETKILKVIPRKKRVRESKRTGVQVISDECFGEWIGSTLDERHYARTGSWYPNVKKYSAEQFVHHLHEQAMTDPQRRLPSLENLLKVIFSLPQRMHKYATTTSENLQAVCSNVHNHLDEGTD